MKINDVIIEQGVGQELWRRATMRPEQKRELEQMESMLVKLTKLPLKQVQKNSKDILKQYKKLLNRNDDWEKTPIGREQALATAIKPFYPEVSKMIMNAYGNDKIEKAPAQPSTKGQQPIQPEGPAVNITQTVPDGMQYRFQHPEYWKDDVNVIIRQSGIYIDKLPKKLRGGQVRRDKETGLYKVDRSDNIAKLNNAYNTAADEGRVIEEPAGAL